MENLKSIQCPNCGQAIDVNEALVHRLEEEYSSKYNQKLIDVRKQYDGKYSELKKLDEALEKKKTNLNEVIEKGINAKLLIEKNKLEKNLRHQLEEEKSEEIKSYKEQIEEKVKETKDLNKIKASFERLQREKNELQEKLEVELQQKLTQLVDAERKKIKSETESKAQLKISEKELIINQLKDQLKSAQLKAESGSTQIQGEAQELVIEDFLKENFPTDSIQEIKKGMRGADILHIVNANGFDDCGRIYFESKRTKDFQKSWLEKFKSDMREVNANFGVLVTDCLPKDMKRFGQKNGIWICTFDEFKGLCFILREFVITLNNVVSAQEDKGGKMELLYSYLTGNEFRMKIEAIVEGFTEMHDDLTKEKRAMELLWKKREKQIQKVVMNTTHMYGSIKGIAGKAIISIKALELPGKKDE